MCELPICHMRESSGLILYICESSVLYIRRGLCWTTCVLLQELHSACRTFIIHTVVIFSPLMDILSLSILQCLVSVVWEQIRKTGHVISWKWPVCCLVSVEKWQYQALWEIRTYPTYEGKPKRTYQGLFPLAGAMRVAHLWGLRWR